MEGWDLYTGTGRCWGPRVRMAPTVTVVGESAFEGSARLEEVDLGNVTQIGKRAFAFGKSLVHVRIPPSVSYIDDEAFLGSSKLERLELIDGIRTIGPSAFRASRLRSLTVPSTLVNIRPSAFKDCKLLKSVDFSEGSEQEITIDRRAFFDCYSLKSLTFRSPYTNIEPHAFCNCIRLRKVDFGEGIHHIMAGAFEGCDKLSSIGIPPNSFVINWEDPHGDDPPHCSSVRETTFLLRERDVDQTIISGNLVMRGTHLAEEIKGKIDLILGQPDETSHETMVEKTELIRTMIARVKMADAATSLELALWKISINEGWGIEIDGGVRVTRKRRRDAKQLYRLRCGSDIIIPNVLLYLDGS